ncbi:MAG: 50S ribosomal protein L1 [Cytophagia bacterium]|nr:50S ribosomal protein L1 [Cytophagia bacterium]
MSAQTKNQKKAQAQVDANKAYRLSEASELVKQITFTKFDASVDVNVRLGVDPRKANQMVRGIVTLPHGTGKVARVLVLCNPDKEAEAKAAGADFVGLDEFIQKIEGGWTDVDVIITQPGIMAKVGRLGQAVNEVKAGKIDFKVDKFGIVHAGIGRVSFSPKQLEENATELIQSIVRLKPSAAKGTYIKSIYLSSTMSPGICIEPKSIAGT